MKGYLCEVSEDVEREAADISEGAGGEREEAELLFEWVRDGFVWDMKRIRGARYLLSEEPKYAMSFDKSNLLVALLRARGFEARFRFMSCVFKNDYKDRLDDSVHAPVEVVIGGDWVTADPAFGEATSEFKEVSKFGEETWEEIKNEKKVKSLPRWFVYSYNYVLKYIHPDIKRIRRELREVQDV